MSWNSWAWTPKLIYIGIQFQVFYKDMLRHVLGVWSIPWSWSGSATENPQKCCPRRAAHDLRKRWDRSEPKMDVYDQIWLWGINDVVSKMSSNIVLWKWQLLDGFRYVNNDDRGCHIRERLFCLHTIYIYAPRFLFGWREQRREQRCELCWVIIHWCIKYV